MGNMYLQSPVVIVYLPLYTGITPLWLVVEIVTLLSLMYSQAARQLFFLGTLEVYTPLSSHQMVYYLYLGAMIKPSRSGMSRLVELSKHSVAT